MTEDLSTWLRAIWDAEEAALIRKRDGHEGPCINYEGQDPADYTEYDTCSRHIAVAKATPYRDAAFGLAEVDAKRRILALHDGDHECSTIRRGVDAVGVAYEEIDNCTWVLGGDCSTVRLLALPCADRPGYRSEWTP